MRVVILIPTYNEKENIGKLLKELIRRTSKIRKHKFAILIVDDKSPDGTGEIVRQFATSHKTVVLLSGRKKGLGKAMIRGYQYAVKKLKAEVIISNEADFAFSFKHLSYMLGKIEEGFDVVVGSRHVGAGKTTGWTYSRRLNHWVANMLFATYVAGIREVHDHNGAFRGVRVRGVIDKINFDKLKISGFAFFFYSLYLFSKETDKFHEFPSTYTFRKKGESKISFNPKYMKTYLKDITEYVKLAFNIRLERYKI